MTTATATNQEQMEVVIVGHVDHGKSTVIGRLMADTGSLPEGKLEAVRASCARNSRPFEYAFLLDALKNEQAQGITIDTARCFFKTAKRRYIIHDAPGHVEFLKNMITGAAQAQAALLVIDADEGVQENSKRHGYILAMLGVRQVAVLVNKMDLVGYDADVFEGIVAEYADFLGHLGVTPQRFIPISAREGDNIAHRSIAMDWYDGPTILGQMDAFRTTDDDLERPFRMSVHDIYKFTAAGDDRRIVAGTINTGTVAVGDEVVFLPSGKRSRVASLEVFNDEEPTRLGAGQAAGFTLDTQVYIRPGELAYRADEVAPVTATRLRVNLFWMGRDPFVRGRKYKLKLGTARVPVELVHVEHVLDASELTTVADKEQVDRHDVAQVILETTRPVAFDLADVLERTARLVIVDGHQIAACGTILATETAERSLLDEQVEAREYRWERGSVDAGARAAVFGHLGKTILFTGADLAADGRAQALAKRLEARLFLAQQKTYFLAIGNVFDDLGSRQGVPIMDREEHILQLGQLARVMADAGLLFITGLAGADAWDLVKLARLAVPAELFIVCVGAAPGDGVDALTVTDEVGDDEALDRIVGELTRQSIIPEYTI